MTEPEIDLRELLRARYGADAPEIEGTADTTLGRLLTHKSVRHYRQDALPPYMLEWMVAAAQSAATSSNLQTWSVVALQDSEHKAEAAFLCGDQDFIRQAPLFLVFCADLARLTFVAQQVGLPDAGLDYLEMFVMATIDAALAAQNAATAAESLGLGICYVGAARNRPRELAVLLQLPRRVIALFGMAVGWPAEGDGASIRPRLPQPEVLHRETYSEASRSQWIEHYDATMRDFYQTQQMNVQGNWSRHSARRIATVEALNGRDVMRQILQERGFGLK